MRRETSPRPTDWWGANRSCSHEILMGKSVGGEPPQVSKYINGEFINYIFLISIEGKCVAITKFLPSFFQKAGRSTNKVLPSFFKSGERSYNKVLPSFFKSGEGITLPLSLTHPTFRELHSQEGLPSLRQRLKDRMLRPSLPCTYLR